MLLIIMKRTSELLKSQFEYLDFDVSHDFSDTTLAAFDAKADLDLPNAGQVKVLVTSTPGH
jgi:hypothetical protein